MYKCKYLINILIILITGDTVLGNIIIINDNNNNNNNNNKTNNNDENISTNLFYLEDYVVLVTMLIISCGIGLFYAFISKKKSTTSDDFLLGGSSMSTGPMAMSLATSFITAIELLGNPAEMYQHGSQYWLICLAFILVMPITSNFYLPVFTKLRMTSCFEYMEVRFSKAVRFLASGLYIIQMTLYTSVAVYAPALALSNVTGLNTYIAVSLVYMVCIFYSTQGGMKAVIMTDTFQTAVLLGSLILIVFYGASEIDVASIWSHNYNTDRLHLFNMDPNPTIRHSFWSVVVGGTFYWLSMFCANQSAIQKYLSVEKISQVRSALWFSAICLIFIYSINFYTGMIMVTHYKNCDPIQSGTISAADQLLPLYVMNVLGQMKGVTGFFVSGVFAASLGTVAAALTSISAAVCKDFIITAFNYNIPTSKGALMAKWISLIAGVASFLLIFVVERMGSILQVAISFNGIVGGVSLGLFTLGMFFPKANAKGAIIGSIVATALVMWIGIGAQVAMAKGDIVEETKAVSIAGCLLNNTIYDNRESSALTKEKEVFILFKISYLWYSAIGCMVTIIIGVLVSLLTNKKDSIPVSEELLSPPIVSLMKKVPNKWEWFRHTKILHVSKNESTEAIETISGKLRNIQETNLDSIHNHSSDMGFNVNCEFKISDEKLPN